MGKLTALPQTPSWWGGGSPRPPQEPHPPRLFGLRPYWLCCVVLQHPPKINPSYGLVEDVSLPGRFAAHSDRCSHGTWAEFGVEVWGLKQASAIGGGAGGGTAPPPMTGLGAPCTLGPPTLTPVDRNKTYCFHELVLNLPAPLDIQSPKCFQLQGGFAPLTRGSAPGPRWGICTQTPVIGSCSALAMVPPNH